MNSDAAGAGASGPDASGASGPDASGASGPDASGASRKRLLGATAVMAAGTFFSRILGFVRTMLVAFALGNVTTQGDTFTLATVVPNNLYMIFAGGALNTVLVPQIVRHTHHDSDGGVAYVNRIMTAFLLALGVLTALALVFTPQVMGLWMGDAWQAGRLAPHRDALFFLAYLTMPQLFFYGVFFLVGQVLNAHDRFGPMMWAPIVNNVVQIGVLGTYAVLWASAPDRSAPFTTDQMLLLGIGSTAGIVLQTAALIPYARKIGLRYRPRFDLRGVGLGATFHLAKWAIGYVLLTQAAALVVTRLASTATVVDPANPGPGLLAYNEAYLTWILPHSLITVSLATALLPSASRLAAADDMDGVGEEIGRTLRLANTFIVPAALGLGVLAYPFANLVFGNGAGAADWSAVGLTLVMFAVGLVPYTIQYLYLRGFYALEDMRRAFMLQIPISAANAVGAWLWVTLDPDPMTVAPRLALCYSLSYVLGAIITYRTLRRRLPSLNAGPMLGHVIRVTAAALPGAALAWWVTRVAGGHGRFVLALGFLAGVVLILGLFVVVARALRVEEITEAIGILSRRLGRGRRRSGPPDAPAPAALPVDVSDGVQDDDRTPLLAYPRPEAVTGSLPGRPGDCVAARDVLDGRYRLDRLLVRRSNALTWLGRDLLLSRSVLIHALPPEEPRTLEILDDARLAAMPTDARFFKVFDVVLAEGRPCSYIVCEYEPGESLEVVLRNGRLTQREACWAVLQASEGLQQMHSLGLYHRRLNPETIVITSSGNVKIVGFLLESALHPAPLDSALPGELADVQALGRVLHAALTATWPGRPAYGLPAAPADERGNPLPPRHLLTGVSPATNEAVARILNPDAASWQQPIATVTQLAAALTDVLGGTDASRDLELRLQASEPAAASAWGTVPRRAVASGTGVGGEIFGDIGGDVDDLGDAYASEFGVSALDASALDLTVPLRLDPFDPESPDAESPSTPTTPDEPVAAVPPTTADPTRERAPRWLKLLALVFVATLAIGLSGVFLNQYRSSRGAPAPTPVPIVGVRDFDPRADGGDDSENGAQARLAADGDATTVWHSERYGRTALFNGRKPGVGLVVDLGSVRKVATVRVRVQGTTDLQVRVPSDQAGAPSMAAADRWRTVGSAPGTVDEAVFTLTTPVESRYLLVYVTRLPALPGGGFQAAIAEISAAG